MSNQQTMEDARKLGVRKRLGLETARRIQLNLAKEHPLRQLFWECTLRCNQVQPPLSSLWQRLQVVTTDNGEDRHAA